MKLYAFAFILASTASLFGQASIVVERFPNAITFSPGSKEVQQGGIVKEVQIAKNCEHLKLEYVNATGSRIKPNVKVLILNDDGIILQSFSDNWLISSLKPDESKTVRVNINPKMPDELMFSRFVQEGIWDLKPAFLIVASTQMQTKNLNDQIEKRIAQLDAPTLLESSPTHNTGNLPDHKIRVAPSGKRTQIRCFASTRMKNNELQSLAVRLAKTSKQEHVLVAFYSNKSHVTQVRWSSAMDARLTSFIGHVAVSNGKPRNVFRDGD